MEDGMQYTTKGRMAVTALIDLAVSSDNAPVALHLISERQNISLPYLEVLFKKLSKKKIVKGVRGPGGGYVLAGSGLSTSIANIIHAVDGASATPKFRGKGSQKKKLPRCVNELWNGLDQVLHAHLSAINLQQLVDKYQLASH
jgi:Rrf2 family iron-sulfur cluster assembly transcriptional regulator